MSSGRYPLRLLETFRTVFYTPIYVTVAGGYLESAGLDVAFATCPPPIPPSAQRPEQPGGGHRAEWHYAFHHRRRLGRGDGAAPFCRD